MPILLSPQWVTASWAIEALVLLWIAQRLGSVFLRHACYVLFGIVIVRLAVFDLGRTVSAASACGRSANGRISPAARRAARGVWRADRVAGGGLVVALAIAAERAAVVERANDIPDLAGGRARRAGSGSPGIAVGLLESGAASHGGLFLRSAYVAGS